MPKVNVGGAALDYIDQGSGVPVVFVHGSIGDLRTWALQVDSFAERHRVIAYTRRHYHGSEDPRPNQTPSASSAADDLIALIGELRLAPTHVVGASYGAFTSMLAASKRPDLVRSLVLGEPPAASVLSADPDGKRVWDQFLETAFEPGRAKISAGDIDGGLRTFVDGVIGPGAFDTLPPPIQDRMRENAHTLPLEAEPADAFGAQDASRITMPVLMLGGERSPSMFAEINKRLRMLLPQAEQAEIPAASHAMQAENAPAYNEAVLRFLAAH